LSTATASVIIDHILALIPALQKQFRFLGRMFGGKMEKKVEPVS